MFFVLVAFALQASFPEVADMVVPYFVYHPCDGGPPSVYADAASSDAGTRCVHHGHGAHHTPTGPGGDLELDTTAGRTIRSRASDRQLVAGGRTRLTSRCSRAIASLAIVIASP